MEMPTLYEADRRPLGESATASDFIKEINRRANEFKALVPPSYSPHRDKCTDPFNGSRSGSCYDNVSGARQCLTAVEQLYDALRRPPFCGVIGREELDGIKGILGSMEKKFYEVFYPQEPLTSNTGSATQKKIHHTDRSSITRPAKK